MERQTNIELLRILAMFAIVIGHFILQTDAINSLNGFDKYAVVFFSSARRMAVGVFLMVGCWFMVDSKFKASRIINLYLQLIFYTFSVFFFMKMFNIPVGIQDTIRLIFPFSNFSLWFVSAYICLLALSPFLHLILEWKRIILKKFLILLFLLIFVFSMIYIKQDTIMCVILSFIFYYLGIGYYKKYLHGNINLNKYILLSIGIIIYISLVTIKYSALVNNTSSILNIIDSYIKDYHCIVNICCSFPIFFYFINTKFKLNKTINYISSATLAVYIFHQAPGFIHYLWYDVYKYETIVNSRFFIIYIFLIPVSLYIACLFFEFIRKKYVMPLIINSKLYERINKKTDEYFDF